MDSSRGFTMLRCRRCRKNYIDSTCLNLMPSTEERSVAQCSVWHVNVDALPNGMLAAIHQAQWTVGKLHCGNCSARLGGFNFINHSRCPCGQNITVHLSKSRVDRHPALPLQQGPPPRGTRPAPEDPGTDPSGGAEPASAPTRDSPARPPLPGCDAMSCVASVTQATPTYAQASSSSSSSSSSSLRPSDGEAGPTLRHPTSKCCVPHRAGRRLQTPGADAPPGGSSSSPSSSSPSSSSSSSSALFPPGPPERLAAAWTETDRLPRPTAAPHQVAAQRPPLPATGGPPSGPAPPPPPPSGPEVPGVVVSAPTEEPPDSPMFLRGRTITDSIGELATPMPAPQPAPSAVSAALSRLSKREKNRLKSNRRKQRRRERWIHSLLEQEQSLGGLLTDSEEEDREGFTCAVCLDLYYCPYSCHPCGHVFCEPCLRTLARSRPGHTPCPLCRTLISHTLFQKELNETTESFFPKVFNARKNNFQRAPCSRWPLPSGPKRFHIFWGYQRQPAEPGRRWPLGPAGFTLDALDLADMRGWLFDVDLVIIYIHSVNWILAFLLLCFLLYFFFS
ncbi:E3 ubiquitin-protein ligase RNF180-like [Gadus chalcogrammus]|uniref:E3 ubiquitin-protein ligase RNF180-like n=1 Tax=Gadus chalcogrammus TaxID=1042646 RepID=UPI0024C30DD6|nr:E3 ubiquitin-protein ligase RNF180-like [Gadus chalcogrammus]